jgi:TIR domain
VRQLIRESDVFIAVISRLSVASPECHDEIDQANLQKKKLLPVQVQDGFNKTALHEALRTWQKALLRFASRDSISLIAADS